MTAPLPLLLSRLAGRGSCRSQRWRGEKGAKESQPQGAPGQRWVLPAPGQEQAGPRDAGRMRGCRQDAGMQAARSHGVSRPCLSFTLASKPFHVHYY